MFTVREYISDSKFTLPDDLKGFTSGSLKDFLAPKIADQNWEEFFKSWTVDLSDPTWGTQRNVLRALAAKFNLGTKSDVFNSLWEIAKSSRKYFREIETKLVDTVDDAYRHVARLAAMTESTDLLPTFARVKVLQSDRNIVVFSDHHMTTVAGLDFFKRHSADLYVDVLDYYIGQSYCIVENGDLEDCLMHDINSATADSWAAQASVASFPIVDNSDWKDFLQTRYNLREEALDKILSEPEFEQYYARVKNLTDEQYVRLAGNHDTYLDDSYEAVLKSKIESALGGKQIYDVLRVLRRRTRADPGRASYYSR